MKFLLPAYLTVTLIGKDKDIGKRASVGIDDD